MATFTSLNGYEVEDSRAREDLNTSVVQINARIDSEVEEINSTIDTKVEEINSTIEDINGEIETLNSNLNTKLCNTYNLILDKSQSTTWAQVCKLNDYTLYIVELVSLESNIGINSGIHFANSITNHTAANPFRIYNPVGNGEYGQICVGNGNLLFMTSGPVSLRISGVK